MAHDKPLVYTAHARHAAAERQLDPDWIRRAALEPDWQEADPNRPDVVRRFRVIPEYEGRVLRVVCLESANEVRILTAFFDRGARRP